MIDFNMARVLVFSSMPRNVLFYFALGERWAESYKIKRSIEKGEKISLSDWEWLKETEELLQMLKLPSMEEAIRFEDLDVEKEIAAVIEGKRAYKDAVDKVSYAMVNIATLDLPLLTRRYVKNKVE